MEDEDVGQSVSGSETGGRSFEGVGERFERIRIPRADDDSFWDVEWGVARQEICADVVANGTGFVKDEKMVAMRDGDLWSLEPFASRYGTMPILENSVRYYARDLFTEFNRWAAMQDDLAVGDDGRRGFFYTKALGDDGVVKQRPNLGEVTAPVREAARNKLPRSEVEDVKSLVAGRPRWKAVDGVFNNPMWGIPFADCVYNPDTGERVRWEAVGLRDWRFLWRLNCHAPAEWMLDDDYELEGGIWEAIEEQAWSVELKETFWRLVSNSCELVDPAAVGVIWGEPESFKSTLMELFVNFLGGAVLSHPDPGAVFRTNRSAGRGAKNEEYKSLFVGRAAVTIGDAGERGKIDEEWLVNTVRPGEGGATGQAYRKLYAGSGAVVRPHMTPWITANHDLGFGTGGSRDAGYAENAFSRVLLLPWSRPSNEVCSRLLRAKQEMLGEGGGFADGAWADLAVMICRVWSGGKMWTMPGSLVDAQMAEGAESDPVLAVAYGLWGAGLEKAPEWWSEGKSLLEMNVGVMAAGGVNRKVASVIFKLAGYKKTSKRMDGRVVGDHRRTI